MAERGISVDHATIHRWVVWYSTELLNGGAGTTTAAARAGTPQVVVPQVADQLYWAGRVSELGIGVAHDGPIPRTVSLLAPLRTALAPETRKRAAAFAKTVRSDGTVIAAGLLVAAVQGGSQ